MKVLGYAWLILLLVPLQVVLVDRISLFGIRPDLPLVAVCLIGLYHGEIDALLAGIAIGFAQDLFCGGVHWGNLCLKPMLGLIAGLASRNVLNLRTGLLFCLLLLSARLWYLQVVKGPYYRELAEQNRVRTVDLKPARGLIFDRHGELLANNVPSFNLYLTVEDIRDREGLAAALEDLIGLPRAETMKRLIQQAKSYVPILLKSGLTLREAALLEGHRLELTGLRVQAESQRNYVHGPLGSHLLGYVGEVSPEQQEEPDFAGLVQGSIVGKAGVEKTYDRMLRGKPGEKTIEVDARGNERKTVTVVEQTPGEDLYLSVDL